MNARFVMFLTILCSFLLGSGYYLGARFSGVVSPRYALVTWITVYGIILLQIAGPFFYRLVPDRDNRYFVVRWIMFSCMGIGASMILYTVAADCAVVVLGFLFPDTSGEISDFGAAMALSLVFITSVVGTAQVAVGPRIYHVKVPLTPAFAALKGFRLAQVSDLHVGPTIGHRSGHTHGGQFFPFTFIVRLAQPFVKGLHRAGRDFWIYVNRGTGYWGPPIRFLVPPEITLITLGD